MLREIIRPTTQSYNINIPKEYINKDIEILIFPVNDKENLDKEIKALSDHSANNIKEWLDDKEDEVWR